MPKISWSLIRRKDTDRSRQLDDVASTILRASAQDTFRTRLGPIGLEVVLRSGTATPGLKPW